jgi:sec-independent protein translocase protein TatA
MPGWVGWPELLVLVVVLLIIFGPKRLPEMGRSLGKGMREFKDSVSGKGDDEDEGPAELNPASAVHMDESPTFCSSCGNPVNADAQFCGKCGKPVTAADTDDTTRQPATVEHDG